MVSETSGEARCGSIGMPDRGLCAEPDKHPGWFYGSHFSRFRQWIFQKPYVYRNEKEMENEMIANFAVTFRPLLCYFRLVLEIISKNPRQTMREMILCANA